MGVLGCSILRWTHGRHSERSVPFYIGVEVAADRGDGGSRSASSPQAPSRGRPSCCTPLRAPTEKADANLSPVSDTSSASLCRSGRRARRRPCRRTHRVATRCRPGCLRIRRAAGLRQLFRTGHRFQFQFSALQAPRLRLALSLLPDGRGDAQRLVPRRSGLECRQRAELRRYGR